MKNNNQIAGRIRTSNDDRRVLGLGCRVLGFRALGVGFRVQSSGFRL